MSDGQAIFGAIEAGGTKFVLAIAGTDGTILARERIATRGPDETLADANRWFTAQEARYGAIAALGVASFGPLDIDPASPTYGVIGPTPKPGWQGTSYREAFARIGVPVAVDTDVNAAALGEWQAWGATGTLAYTTVGTGIGTGVVKSGRPLAGASHYEAGHIRVPHDLATDPFPGACPFHGDCVEGLASGSAITARWGRDLSCGDPAEVALIAGYLADLAAALVLTHMPDRLVFGGGVMKGPGMIEALGERLRERLAGYIPAWDGDLADRVATPRLGDDAGITGALALARAALAGPPR